MRNFFILFDVVDAFRKQNIY